MNKKVPVQKNKTENNEQDTENKKSENKQIAFITVIGTIIVALIYIYFPRPFNLTVTVTDEQNFSIPKATVAIKFIRTKSHITDNNGQVFLLHCLPEVNYIITASAEGYKTEITKISNRPTIPLTLKQENLQPIMLDGWTTWGDNLSASTSNDYKKRNSVEFNGKVISAGYVCDHLPRNIMAGKTLVLFLRNTGKSTYSKNRLLKVTVNRGDQLLTPNSNKKLIEGEYIPAGDGRIEYTIPQDFDGKLGFVFHEVLCSELQITAYYRDQLPTGLNVGEYEYENK